MSHQVQKFSVIENSLSERWRNCGQDKKNPLPLHIDFTVHHFLTMLQMSQCFNKEYIKSCHWGVWKKKEGTSKKQNINWFPLNHLLSRLSWLLKLSEKAVQNMWLCCTADNQGIIVRSPIENDHWKSSLRQAIKAHLSDKNKHNTSLLNAIIHLIQTCPYTRKCQCRLRNSWPQTIFHQ